MTVVIVRLTLLLAENHSLKDKRRVLRTIKDPRAQQVQRVDRRGEDNDLWQRAVLGVTLVGQR